MVLPAEEAFGRLLRVLREDAGHATPADLHEGLLQVSPEWSFTTEEIVNLETGEVMRPRLTTVDMFARYFHYRKLLTSHFHVALFCLRGGYRITTTKVNYDQDLLPHLDLRPAIKFDAQEFQEFWFTQLQFAEKSDSVRSLLSAFGKGLNQFVRTLNALVPEATPPVRRLLRRAEFLLSAEVFDEEAASKLVLELQRHLESTNLISDKFRLPYVLVRLQERRGQYGPAMLAAQNAYNWAQMISEDRGPAFHEPLAQLCEVLGDAYLNVGTSEYWPQAESMFQRSFELREDLKTSLGLLVSENQDRNLNALLQLARARTASRDLAAGEESYLNLLKRWKRMKPLMRAHVLKELADNYRFAENQEQAAARFNDAIKVYRAVPPKTIRDAPAASIEIILNIGYCLARLERTAEALQEFHRALAVAIERKDARRVGYACLQIARYLTLPDDAEEIFFYTYAAFHIMEKLGAAADASQARDLNERARACLTQESCEAVEQRTVQSEYWSYMAQP